MRADTNRRTLLKWLGATTAIVALPGTGRAFARPASTARKPNIVFILVDDMGYADLSVTGSSHIKTPAIDSLARDGVRLTQGYASTPICSPTRTALLTGCWAQSFPVGVEEPLGPNAPAHIGVPYDRPTIASVMRDIGYHTKLIGKWHLGDPPEHGPLQHGYNEFFGIVEGAADYFRHHIVVHGKEVGMGLARGNSPVEAGGYLTDLFGAEAVETIEKSSDKPFFLSLHFNAPHWPWEGREDAVAAKTIPDSFDYDGGSLKKYEEMMEAVDDNVAKILAALEQTGKTQDTIVVFTSDNGGERYSQTWPFVGHKGEVLEGGVRVPIIVRWPGHIAPGSVSDQVMASMDFLPTLLTMAGGNVAKAGTFDGADLAAQLTGKAASIERTLFWRFKANNQAAVRKGDWKYVRIGGKERLFNLAEDEHERAERQGAEPQKFDELKRLWDDWNRQMVPYRVDGFSEDVTKTYIDRY